jgi:superfamily II DNA/RNA helicase
MYRKQAFSRPKRGISPSRFRGSSRGPSRGSSNSNRFQGQRIDVSRFINRAVITEEVERFVPEHAFADFAITPELKAKVLARGYVTPTPIQDRAIPHVLRGEDVVGLANTGTGKTAAFLIPLIDKVLKNKSEEVLIVVPTRELAIQIDEELRALAKGLKLFSVVCVGGAPIGRQISELRYQNHFIIGTPGRIKDLIERRVLKLTNFKTIVLDEADRMLDMGFINDMRFMMDLMPASRQTLFFTATMSPEIERLINKFLREPVRLSVKTGDTVKSVDQDVVRVKPGAAKIDVLRDLLKQSEFSKVLVFGKTKHGVERLSELLCGHGVKAESIHGNKNHGQRQRALKLFKDNAVNVLVATDVAARGLDIPNVTHVINYDLPATYGDYVHRIGRTGRAGKAGKALTFIE